MRLRTTLPLVMAAALIMTGCGSGDPQDYSQLPGQLLGEWIRDQESNDGGETWVDRRDNLLVTYHADRTWTDNRNRSGTYNLYNNRITVYWPGNSTRYARIFLLSNGNRMEWTYYRDGAFRQQTGYRARLTRVSAR